MPSVFRYFRKLRDPRRSGLTSHPLTDLIAIAVLAVICGAEGWDDMNEFGLAKQKWLCTFLELPHGIASADTFARVFARLEPSSFRACFVEWARSLVETTGGRLIAIDGKTARRSFDRAADRTALHTVRAWVRENRMVLGQYATDAKSNEITAIPALLDLLDIKGAVVTTDAMGTQKEIAGKILEKGADYVLALKANHANFYEEVVAHFEPFATIGMLLRPHTTDDRAQTGHGRIERRRVVTATDVERFKAGAEWPGLKSVTMVESERTVGDKTSLKRRYYISSKKASARTMGKLIRGHWSVENDCHWTLDVAFREDESRVRTGHAPDNLAQIRSIVLNMLKRESTSKRGIRAKQKNAGWNHDYLLRVLLMGVAEDQPSATIHK